jgi:exopolyphosphatase/guanosine-5'-triphosphate,3'-diphosphate pyrophosphatase
LVIDIGTNSVLALLAKVQEGKLSVIFDKKKTTRLGEGLISTGQLSENAMRRTANAIAEFAKDAQYDSVVLLGTEALRTASNSDQFNRMLESTINFKPLIVSGRKEAELSFLGALYGLPIENDNILLIDVGGGSTELVNSLKGKIKDSISIPIGALKLLELSNNDKIDYYRIVAAISIESAILNFKIASDAAVIATGGTITSVAAMAAGQKSYDSAGIHGMSLDIARLNEIILKFEGADRRTRESLIAFDPERADLILPGLGIFLSVLGIIKKDSLMVSTGGLRFGAALYPEKIWT